MENDEQLDLIADETYLYWQKSFSYLFQRETYSVQIKQNLLKPFVLSNSSGYKIDIFGLYPGGRV